METLPGNKKHNTPHIRLAPDVMKYVNRDFKWIAFWGGYMAFGRTPLIAQGRVIIQKQAGQVIHE